jgi:hypothetical protein
VFFDYAKTQRTPKNIENYLKKQEVLGITNSTTFPTYTSLLFEVLGPNLMELNISEYICRIWW